MRDPNLEFSDNAERKYQYDFDTIVRRYLLHRVEAHLSRDRAPLELGAYKGDMTAQLLEIYDHVEVIEGSTILADEIRGRFRDRVSVTTALFESAEPSRTYSDIFLVHTLEHLDNPVDTLRRIGTWLGDDGKLYVAVPNANALSRQIAVLMGLIDYNSAVTAGEYEHGHRRTYSLDTLLADLRKADLDVIEFGGVVVKGLANYQFDAAIESGIVSHEYLDASDQLGRKYPDLCATVFAVCTRSGHSHQSGKAN